MLFEMMGHWHHMLVKPQSAGQSLHKAWTCCFCRLNITLLRQMIIKYAAICLQMPCWFVLRFHFQDLFQTYFQQLVTASTFFVLNVYTQKDGFCLYQNHIICHRGVLQLHKLTYLFLIGPEGDSIIGQNMCGGGALLAFFVVLTVTITVDASVT